MLPDANSELHPDAAGWALGALDSGDAAAFEVHLRDCAECRAAVAEFEPVARAIGFAAPAVEPPPDLEARTLASLRGAVLAAKQTREVAGPASAKMARHWHWHWNLPVFSVAAVLGAAVAVVAMALVQSVPAVAGTRIPLHPVAASLTSAATPPSGEAIARHSPGGWSIRLTVKDLPHLGSGEFYECWYAGPDNGPGHAELITAGTFTGDGSGTGTFTMWSAADPQQFKTMEITIQRADDPGQPGKVLLSGSPQNAETSR
jgi:hypothetical protein